MLSVLDGPWEGGGVMPWTSDMARHGPLACPARSAVAVPRRAASPTRERGGDERAAGRRACRACGAELPLPGPGDDSRPCEPSRHLREHPADNLRVDLVHDVHPAAGRVHEPPQAAARPCHRQDPRALRGGPLHLARVGRPPAGPRNLWPERWGTPAHPLTARGPFPPHLVGAKSKDAVGRTRSSQLPRG
jgi:hypothetical protein